MLTTNDFTWNEETQTFSKELSDFGPDGPPWEKIWPDSMDNGIRVQSSITGQVAAFQMDGPEYKDGEFVALHLKPTRESIRENYKLKNVKMILWND